MGQGVRLAGLDPLPTPHDMRHTAVSLWIATGADDLVVARYAGHRSTSFTKDRYGHLFKDAGGVLADRLDILITSATDSPVTTMEEFREAEESRRAASERAAEEPEADEADADEPS